MSLFEDKMNLGLTTEAAKLYFASKDHWTLNDEVRKLVEVCAVKDWGENTVCLFTGDEIVVENLDGRREVFNGKLDT